MSIRGINDGRRRAFALLIVVLTIAALAILATPFMVSMKLQERSSRRAVARARARFALTAAYNHALAQLLEAAGEYGDLAVRFDDLPAGFRWRWGERGLMVSAEIQDEQGKINANTAPVPLLTNLFADPDAGLGLSRAAAALLAAAVDTYRSSGGAFPTLDSLNTDEMLQVDQVDALRRHLTVHSVSEPAGFSRVNFNTAPTPVLRAVLSGVRARYVQPTPDPDNAGNGTMSLVRLAEAASGVWAVTCTAAEEDPDTGAHRFTFAVESYPENDTDSRTDHGQVELIEYPNTPASCTVTVDVEGGTVEFTLCNGTTDFAEDDAFTFSAQRFSFVRDGDGGQEFDPAKVDRLLGRFRAQVAAADLAGGTVTLDDGLNFPATGWVLVRGDMIHYASRSGPVLEGCTEFTITPAPGDPVAVVVPGPEALDAFLAEAVAADDLRESDRSAILANAKNPDDESAGSALLNATTGLCFEPTGRYTIQALGIVNDAAGNAVEQMRVRRVIALEQGSTRSWTLAEQEQFDAQLVGSGRAGLITLPGASYVADVPASGAPTGHGVTLAPVVEPGNGWRFNGPGRFGATNWAGMAFGPAVPGTELVPGEDLFANGDAGLFVSDTGAFRAFAAPAGLAVSDTLRRLALWVKPSEAFDHGAEHVFFDTGPLDATEHLNRVRLSYSSGGELVFHVADEAKEPRSARVAAPVAEADFAKGTWHKIEAVWGGMDIDRMALLLDGRLIGSYGPSGAAAEQTASPALTDEKWIARVGNRLKQEGATEPVRDTQNDGTTTGPTSVYGYGACEFINKDASTEKAVFNRVHRGGASTSSAFGKKFHTTVHIPVTDPATPPEDRKVAAAALLVPVLDATDFPDEGFIKIGNEVIKYESKSTAQTDAGGNTYYTLTVPEGGRGQDFGMGDLATRFTSDPAEHNHGATVLCISLKVTSNTYYPMPQLLDVPGNVESYFELTDLDPNTCVVQVEDEWISYTHRAETDYLVHVQATVKTIELEGGGVDFTTSSMRGAGGTEVVAHGGALDVVPVYEVTAGGRLGGGDRVTLLDSDLASAGYQERVAKHAVKSRYGYLVSFPDFLPVGFNIYIKRGTRDRDARLVKFPSGRFRPRRVVAIGAPVFGDGSRAEGTIGSVRLFAHSGSSTQRVKDPITDATSDILFGTLDALFEGGTPWGWSNREFGVGAWPLHGYVKIGDEAVFYKVRHPHNVGYSPSRGAVSQGCSVSVTSGEDVPATGNIVWKRQGGEDDPIQAGFNPYGGYLVVTSYDRTESAGYTKKLEDCTDEILQWLIAQGHVTQEFVDEHGTKDPETGLWSFPEITVEGSWTTSEKREFVFYSEINPKTPGADQYTFVCGDDDRHLYGTHQDGEGQPLAHSPAEQPGEPTLYPRLSGRTVAMAVLQRGGAPGDLALDTTPTDHDAGERILPLPRVPTTVICGPPVDENGIPADEYEGDRIPVEDVADFPDCGYLEITNAAGAREIIYYTHTENEVIPDSNPVRRRYYFAGVRRFRGRFGTTPIDLTDLTAVDDVRQTSDAQIGAYQDPRRVVKLFRPRFHDRTPLEITMGAAGSEVSRSYAPHPVDADLVCFEVKKTIRGARWLSVDWAEEPTPSDDVDILVLARVGGSPGWGWAEPVKWDEVPDGSGRVIYQFDSPKADPQSDAENTLNAVGDTITLRVFFKFKPGYDLSSWQVPVLKSLTLRYNGATRVIESQELNY